MSRFGIAPLPLLCHHKKSCAPSCICTKFSFHTFNTEKFSKHKHFSRNLHFKFLLKHSLVEAAYDKLPFLLKLPLSAGRHFFYHYSIIRFFFTFQTPLCFFSPVIILFYFQSLVASIFSSQYLICNQKQLLFKNSYTVQTSRPVLGQFAIE